MTRTAAGIPTLDIAPEAVQQWRALVVRRARMGEGRCSCGCRCSATTSTRRSVQGLGKP